jgi:hypothetical protein
VVPYPQTPDITSSAAAPFGATRTTATLLRFVTLRLVNVIDMALTVPERPETVTLEPTETLVLEFTVIGFDPPNVCAEEFAAAAKRKTIRLEY